MKPKNHEKVADKANVSGWSRKAKLLFEILESSRDSAFVLNRFLLDATTFTAIFLIGLAIQLIVTLIQLNN